MASDPIRSLAAAVVAACLLACSAAAAVVTLPLRTRDDQNRPKVIEVQVDAAKIGVVVMDMWDRHWDPLATRRIAALVPRMEPVPAQRPGGRPLGSAGAQERAILRAGTNFHLAADGTVLVTASQRPVCDRYVVRMRPRYPGSRLFVWRPCAMTGFPMAGRGCENPTAISCLASSRCG